VLAAVAWWGGHPRVLAVAAALGGVLVFAGLLLPSRLGPVQRGWMALAHAISRITTPVVMGVIYFLVFTPIGILMRLAGKNALVRSEQGSSFWVARSSEDKSSRSMERQF
jgi:hypothetical protein